MTLSQIEDKLRLAGVEDASFDSKQLVMHFCHLSQAYLMANREKDYSGRTLEEAVARREKREPLQYILGEWDFAGGTYLVSEDTLIPRADTELLVEKAWELCDASSAVLDLCTGTGCIAIAIAEKKRCHVTGMDLSQKALDVALENAKKHNVDALVTFFRGDVRQKTEANIRYDLITANPPYISREEMASLEPELSFEPRFALTDESDGLTLIEAIIQNYFPLLDKNGKMLLEHGAAQGEKVRAMATEAGGTAITYKDLAGRERCTVIGR